LIYLDDKSWTKIPILHMGGRVMAGGKKIALFFYNGNSCLYSQV